MADKNIQNSSLWKRSRSREEFFDDVVVGVRGFEPPAPASRRRCSTGLSYTPSFSDDPFSITVAPQENKRRR